MWICFFRTLLKKIVLLRHLQQNLNDNICKEDLYDSSITTLDLQIEFLTIQYMGKNILYAMIKNALYLNSVFFFFTNSFQTNVAFFISFSALVIYIIIFIIIYYRTRVALSHMPLN